MLASVMDSAPDMWEKLEDTFNQKNPGSRFNAYDDLFSIRLGEEETVMSLITRVDEGLTRIQGLRSSGFDLEQNDEDLAIMALLRALPTEEFQSFTGPLLNKSNLTADTVRVSLRNLEINRRNRATPGATSSDLAMLTTRGLHCMYSTIAPPPSL